LFLICSDLSDRSSAGDRTTAAPHHTNSPTRDVLRQAIAELDAASRELDEAQRPTHRLSTAVAELEAAEHNLAELRGQDDAVLAAWLTEGAEGPRPAPNPGTLDAERRIAQLNRDGAAPRAALPRAVARSQGLAERVHMLHRGRDEAVYGAAVDAARVFAERWRVKLVDALRDEAALRGLHSELVTIGNLGDSVTAALGAAKAIADLISETRRSAAVPHDQESARRLVAALMTDASARL
jgi:hypothetical protein